MDQEDIAALNAAHDMELSPALRLLDLESEVGELAKEVVTAQDYGDGEFERTDDLVDEFGDVYYSLLALAAELDIDAETALETSVEKYRKRLDETGDAGSGE
jgi:NTP pyrophosphatase (non-canonical NTP hydrolase)